MPALLTPQDVVSLGLHAALTALDACQLLKPAVAIHLLAAAQARLAPCNAMQPVVQRCIAAR